MVSELLDRFVGSRSIRVYRHYEKVAASHVKKRTQMPDTIRRLVEDDGDTHGWRGRGMSADTRAVLRACYHDDLNNESACALFWYLRNQLYFDQALDRDPRVALLNYEQLLADPHDYTAALFEFAGLSYQSDAGAIIKPQGVGNSNDVLPIEPSVRKLCDEMVERLHAAPHLRVDGLAGRC